MNLGVVTSELTMEVDMKCLLCFSVGLSIGWDFAMMINWSI